MSAEAENVDVLRRVLNADFELFGEVSVRHALFRRRTLRVDLLGIPKAPELSDIALAFEVKGHSEWDIPRLAKCLKQASDYVLATIEPAVGMELHAGKRVMAVFIYPSPSPADQFHLGMVHMASYHRVGTVGVGEQYRERPHILHCGEELWLTSRGWRANARNVLAGKRQIGSQRFSILDELKGGR